MKGESDMFGKKVSIFMILLVMVLVTLACEVSASTAKVNKAVLTTDDAGTSETTVFGQGDIFYCQVELANAPDDTVTKAVWTAVAAEGVDPNSVLTEKEITNGSGPITFNLSNDQLWPIGKYKVDILLNDKPATTLEFEVQ
jgi:hypothetical protein